MSSLPVLVRTGFVTAVLITISALAVAGKRANDRGVKQVAASSLRIGGPLAGAHRSGGRRAHFDLFSGVTKAGEPSQLFEKLVFTNRNNTWRRTAPRGLANLSCGCQPPFVEFGDFVVKWRN
jgi:hypothetical protein